MRVRGTSQLWRRQHSARAVLESATGRMGASEALHETPAPRALRGAEAAELDRKLMSSRSEGGHGVQLEQAMELAGLACAECLEHAFARSERKRCLVVCGPGNNGGDGFVMARHLLTRQHNWHVEVLAPKVKDHPPFNGLLQQMHALSIPVHDSLDSTNLTSFDVVVDAVFGFSFASAPREPFKSIIDSLDSCPSSLMSIDVPSGWPVDGGQPAEGIPALQPSVLCSMSAPKLCSLELPSSAKHYLGGRFIPPSLASEFDLQLPDPKHNADRAVGSQCFVLQ